LAKNGSPKPAGSHRIRPVGQKALDPNPVEFGARAKRVQRVVEDVVLVHLEVRKIKSLQVGDIDICRHDFTALADLFR